MPEQIELDAATLHKAASDVRSTREEVNGDLGRLRDAVDDLAIAWLGDAGTKFQELMQRWNDDVTKLLTAMDDIGNMLDRSANQHEANDQEQAQMVNKYTSSLNP
jgi:WXG100 family type VII secretion target